MMDKATWGGLEKYTCPEEGLEIKLIIDIKIYLIH